MKARALARGAAITCLMLGGLIVLVGCSNQGTSGPTPASSSTTDINKADTEFVLEAGPRLGRTLTAAQLAQSASSNPAVQGFARDLAAARGPQVDRVASWLRDWGEHGADFGHDAEVPGANEPRHGLSEQTMTKLSTLTGPRFDQVFLSAMVVHLDAGAQVWRAEASHGVNPDAVRLAKQLTTEEAEFARRARGLLNR
jgi:uncharacterized protein (DUF305 family)